MSEVLTKMQWVEKFVKGDLFDFLIKKNLIKKGDTVCYAKLCGITMDDFHAYCQGHGYPNLDIPRHEIKTTPSREEGQTDWTLEDGVYKVWFSERNTSFLVYSTKSESDFRSYWIKEMEEVWSYKLNREWVY